MLLRTYYTKQAKFWQNLEKANQARVEMCLLPPARHHHLHIKIYVLSVPCTKLFYDYILPLSACTHTYYINFVLPTTAIQISAKREREEKESEEDRETEQESILYYSNKSEYVRT